jgi:hypothetical protein
VAFVGSLLALAAETAKSQATLPLINGGFDNGGVNGPGWQWTASSSDYGVDPSIPSYPTSKPVAFPDGTLGYAFELVGDGWVGFGGTARLTQTETIQTGGAGEYQWSFWAGQLAGWIMEGQADTGLNEFHAQLQVNNSPSQDFYVQVAQDNGNVYLKPSSGSGVSWVDSYGGFMVTGNDVGLQVGDTVTVTYSTVFDLPHSIGSGFFGGIDGVVVDDRPVLTHPPGSPIYDAGVDFDLVEGVPDGGASAFLLSIGCAFVFALAGIGKGESKSREYAFRPTFR